MGNNKIIFGDDVLIDLTGDTVEESDVLSGKKFHSSDGSQKTGSMNLIAKEYTPDHTEIRDFFNSSTGYPEYITINAVDYANLTVTPTKDPQEFNRDPDNLDKFYLDVYVNGVPTETEDIIAITQDRTVYPSEGKFYENVTVKAVTPTFPSADKILKDEVVKVVSGGYTLASRTGSMPNNGSVSATLDTSTTSYTIPKGYHSGSGTVKVTTQSKTATPSTSDQTITPDSGKVISSVLVKGVTCNFPDADKILKDEVVSVMSNGTTLASILGSFEPEEGTPSAIGTFTTSSTYTTFTPIELGFRPKYVFVWHSEANTGYPNFAATTSYGVYYKDDNEERLLCAKDRSTQPACGIFKETSKYITFTDTGFTHKPYNSNHVKKKAIYMAIG